MSEKPSEKEQIVLDFIGVPRPFAPTYREIARETGLAVPTVQSALKGLQKKGCVTWKPGSSRTIQLGLNAAKYLTKKEQDNG
jgi:DNA-binding IclR family transcriptional regulator